MSEVYNQLTSRIVRLLQEGTPPWRKPWVGHNPMPVNAATKRPYNGINVFLLWLAGEEQGYTTNLWGTAAMWKRLNGEVLKGQIPTSVYLFRRVPVADLKRPGRDKLIAVATVFNVYNLDQIWGCLHLRKSVCVEKEEKSAINFLPAQRIADQMNVKTIHRGTRASYNPVSDCILLPPKSTFDSQIGYWSTRFHELVHSTGHSSRLDRPLTGKFASPDYCFEELIAEIGTAFVCSVVGIPEAQEQMPQHASYVASWLKVLRADDRAIFRAASAAQKAADFITKKA